MDERDEFLSQFKTDREFLEAWIKELEFVLYFGEATQLINDAQNRKLKNIMQLIDGAKYYLNTH